MKYVKNSVSLAMYSELKKNRFDIGSENCSNFKSIKMQIKMIIKADNYFSGERESSPTSVRKKIRSMR